MSKKKKDPGFPYDATPEVHRYSGNADSCFDLVNQYGTYEIQRTMDTDNVFPRIAQGEAKKDPHAVITKDDLERMPGHYGKDLRK